MLHVCILTMIVVFTYIGIRCMYVWSKLKPQLSPMNVFTRLLNVLVALCVCVCVCVCVYTLTV